MAIKKSNAVNFLGGIALSGVVIVALLLAHKPRLVEAPSFLPGVYACRAGNEFCRIDDTVIIRRVNPGGTSYAIHRRSAFVRIIQGKSGPPEYQQEEWDGVYDPVRRELTAAGRMDTIGYSADKNRIHKNDFTYEKIE
jgi:hypothetical protein